MGLSVADQAALLDYLESLDGQNSEPMRTIKLNVIENSVWTLDSSDGNNRRSTSEYIWEGLRKQTNYIISPLSEEPN